MMELIGKIPTVPIFSALIFWLGLLTIVTVLLIRVIESNKSRAWWGLFISWLSLGAAMGFFLWTINSSPVQMQKLEAMLSAYGVFLGSGMVISGIVVFVMRLNGMQSQLTAVACASCIVYLGFLKALGWNLVPWILVTLTIPLFFNFRKSEIKSGSSMILLQSVGTLCGLYMSLHLRDFLAGWGPFQEVVAGMWLLLTGSGA
jgi:hypothetical protein